MERHFVFARLKALGLAAVLSFGGSSAYAATYLVGAGINASQANGAESIAGFRYSANPADTGAAVLPVAVSGSAGAINPTGRDLSYLLQAGDNLFTIERSASFFRVNHFSMNLFFSDQPDPLAVLPSDAPRAGDLVVSTQNNSGTFLSPAAGTLVAPYNAQAPASVVAIPAAAYSGASSFNVGNDTVSVTEFSVFSTPNQTIRATFTVHLDTPSQVPLPAGLPLLFAGLAGLAGLRRFKRVS